jgi:hypothetical protein
MLGAVGEGSRDGNGSTISASEIDSLVLAGTGNGNSNLMGGLYDAAGEDAGEAFLNDPLWDDIEEAVAKEKLAGDGGAAGA